MNSGGCLYLDTPADWRLSVTALKAGYVRLDLAEDYGNAESIGEIMYLCLPYGICHDSIIVQVPHWRNGVVIERTYGSRSRLAVFCSESVAEMPIH